MTIEGRFREYETPFPEYCDEILVKCPRCNKSASVVPAPGSDRSLFSARRLVCGHCGLHRKAKTQSLRFSGSNAPTDPYFELPLWLQKAIGNNVLWAFNLAHLDFIESFVQALLRERRQGEHGWSNSGMVSRFPKWLKSAGNRARVLSAIEEMRSDS